jgi:hypothetical protein
MNQRKNKINSFQVSRELFERVHERPMPSQNFASSDKVHNVNLASRKQQKDRSGLKSVKGKIGSPRIYDFAPVTWSIIFLCSSSYGKSNSDSER